MTALNSLDRENQRIPTGVLKIACGNPSAELWSECRKCAGVSDGSGNKGKKRRCVTEWEAFIIWIRRYWREACADAGSEYISNPGTFQVEDVAEIIANKYDRWSPQNIIAPDFIGLDDLTGKQVHSVVQLLSGKVSERSLRRICDRSGIPAFSRRRRYSRHQILQILRAVADHKSRKVA